MRYFTVKQLADQAGVSRRTLHYYDEIDLLKPAQVGDNGYRLYDEASLLRLQQILLYREMGMELSRIGEILDNPAFDPIQALLDHRVQLRARMARLSRLLLTVDTTIRYLNGEEKMSTKAIFDGLTDEERSQFDQEAVDRWGETAKRTIKRWDSYSEEKRQAVMDEGREIYTRIAESMELGVESTEVQRLLGRWHEHLRNFYEPTLEILAGLGRMYHDDPRFNANFSAIHPDLPAFLRDAVAVYVDRLETELLAQDL